GDFGECQQKKKSGRGFVKGIQKNKTDRRLNVRPNRHAEYKGSLHFPEHLFDSQRIDTCLG
ncbi:hypothetical protein, partial [Symmachiella dynata]|uniref:hypothetical protein n=1 Tax=Symmachiella dynata TaxID=2527995 RepID=UPI0030EBF5E9